MINMLAKVRVLLIFTGLTGIHCITTVSKVTAKTGGSITIPCQYDSWYKNHVKYLCVGSSWNSCKYAVKTNQHHSGRYSIYDDKNQQIFNVTIKDLKSSDTGYYWCNVEINNWGDDGKYFHLSVTDTPSLYVDDQEKIAFNGGDVTIKCFPKSTDMSWCRLGGSCERSESMNGATVSIKHTTDASSVTMRGLKMESSGWYYCAKGDLQIPVHLTVREPPSTTTVTTTRNVSTSSPNHDTSFVTYTSTTIVPDEEISALVELKSFIIPLGLLLFIVMLTLVIWCIVKKKKQTKEASSNMSVNEEEATYCNVEHMRQHSNQRFYDENDVDLTYSSVVVNRQTAIRHVKQKEENVIYSSLA